MWTLVKVSPFFLLYTGKGIDVSLRYWAKSTISKMHLSIYREKGSEIESEALRFTSGARQVGVQVSYSADRPQ